MVTESNAASNAAPEKQEFTFVGGPRNGEKIRQPTTTKLYSYTNGSDVEHVYVRHGNELRYATYA